MSEPFYRIQLIHFQVVLGFSVSAHDGTIGSKVELNPELAHCSGFAALEHLMGAHADKPHTYYAMLSLLVGQPIKDLRLCEQLNVDLVWTHVFGLKTSSSVHEAITSAEFCFDAIIPLFSMIRASLYCGNEVVRRKAIKKSMHSQLFNYLGIRRLACVVSINCSPNDSVPLPKLAEFLHGSTLGGIHSGTILQSNPGPQSIFIPTFNDQSGFTGYECTRSTM